MHIPVAEWLRVEETLTLDCLRSLIANEVQVVRIPQYLDKTACSVIAGGLRHKGYGDYFNAPSVGRIGMSYFETGLREDLIEMYFANAFSNIDLLRDACYPYACPIDTLRCQLDERWPAGCNLQTLHGRKMFVGLSRCLKPGTPLLAHHDMFARHAPHTPEGKSLISQFGINIYVEVPAEGGELALWTEEISDAEFLRLRGDKYAIPLECLDDPDLKVKPQQGDLILFNARKLHAVLPGLGSERLTLSAFFGYRGNSHGLTVWS